MLYPRRLPGLAECGPAKADRFVGIFYFLIIRPQTPN
jgi:hypothetical protein